METHRVHAVVRGRVQGVGYRASLQHEARRLGLVGWVRNLPDGSVELEAEGPRPSVDALLAWAELGPPGSRVDELDSRWLSGAERPAEPGRGFDVRR